METFFEWLDNKNIWIDLYANLLNMYSKHIYDRNYVKYHDELINKLRAVGLSEDANELEMVRLSQDDINYGDRPLNSGESDYHQKRQNYRAGYNAYLDHIESLVKKVSEQIAKSGWENDLNQEINKKFPSSSHNYDDYSDFNR